MRNSEELYSTQLFLLNKNLKYYLRLKTNFYKIPLMKKRINKKNCKKAINK